ncbi:MAG: GWxTD domain-containing protein [bacterium]
MEICLKQAEKILYLPKRKFIARFWWKRDTNTETAKNEFRENYLARVKFANEHFGSIRKGWKTDRGRILLIYEEPDEVERNPSLGDSRRYEIWRYFTQEEGFFSCL